MDEAYIGALHGTDMPLDDEVTYPGADDRYDLQQDQDSGIPVLLVGGSSSQSSLSPDDIVDFDYGPPEQLFPHIDRWVSQHHWREPLVGLCDEMEALVCDSLDPALSFACRTLMNVEIHEGANESSSTLGDYFELSCSASLWAAEGPLGVFADGASSSRGNPFEILSSIGPSCDTLCDGVSFHFDDIEQFCDGQCSCLVDSVCDPENPATWWCCPADLTNSLVNEIDDLGWAGEFNDALSDIHEGFCVASCAGVGFCVDACIGDVNASLDEVLGFATNTMGIEFPGQAQLDRWRYLLDPGSWSEHDSFSAVAQTACVLLEAGKLGVPPSLAGYEARFQMSTMDAICETLKNANPDRLSNGWAGDMFAGARPSQAVSNCNGSLVDRVDVDYARIGKAAVGTAARYGLAFFERDTSTLQEIFQLDQGSYYSLDSDDLFDNDVVVPTWSELMCSSPEKNYAVTMNLNRALAYANHANGKHSDEVAKLVVEWLNPRYDGDADGIVDIVDSDPDRAARR